MRALTVMLLLGLLLAGCGRSDSGAPAAGDADAPEQPAPTAATDDTASVPPRPSGTIQIEAPTQENVAEALPDGVALPDPLPAPIAQQIDAARAALAQQVGVTADTIETLAALSVTWPDGSLGCPLPGMAYPQVQVDGLFVRLRAGGQVFDYHSGGEKALFLCAGKAGERGISNP